MNLKGNNAEKLATTLIIFFILFLTYIIVCFIFHTISKASLDSMVKDAMTFSVTGIAPIVAILLFNDWKEQFLTGIKDEITSQLFELQFNIIRELHVLRYNLSGQHMNEAEYKDRTEKLFNEIKIFENCIKRLERVGLKSKYTNNAYKVKNLFLSLKQIVAYLNHHQTEKHQLSIDEIQKRINQDQITWYWNEIYKNLDNFDQKFNELEELAKDINNWNFFDLKSETN